MLAAVNVLDEKEIDIIIGVSDDTPLLLQELRLPGAKTLLHMHLRGSSMKFQVRSVSNGRDCACKPPKNA
jgi:hypothetical protein